MAASRLGLVALACLLSVAAGATGTKTHRGALECATCETIVDEAQKAAENSTELAHIIAKWDGECDRVFPKNNSETETCRKIVKDVVDILPFLDKQLSDLAWDIPVGFCSVFVQACEVPCCRTLHAPEQVRLSFAGSNLSSMAVSWTTGMATATSTVQWGFGPASQGLPFSATGFNRTYVSAGWLGQVHTAVMTNLPANTTVRYRVGDAEAGWSQTWTFQTLPADAGSAGTALKLAHIADIGYGSASDGTVAALTQLASSNSIHAVLATGDISYADGYQPHWDDFLRKMEPIAARVPLMVAPGNHEFWFNFSAYKARFWMPMAAEMESMYWSMNIGPHVHISMLNTETMFDTANVDLPQQIWLKQDLTDNAGVTWKIAGGHRPLYCSNHDKTQCGLFANWLRAGVEPIFKSFNVDLILAGHQHQMEQSFPLYDDEVVTKSFDRPRAPVYVTNGAAGNREGNSNPQPISWSAWRSRELGFGIITAKGNSLTYDFVGTNMTVLHSFTLTK